MKSCVTKSWAYIEHHHERFGVALFVLPAMLLPVALVGLGALIARLL